MLSQFGQGLENCCFEIFRPIKTPDGLIKSNGQVGVENYHVWDGSLALFGVSRGETNSNQRGNRENTNLQISKVAFS